MDHPRESIYVNGPQPSHLGGLAWTEGGMCEWSFTHKPLPIACAAQFQTGLGWGPCPIIWSRLTDSCKVLYLFRRKERRV